MKRQNIILHTWAIYIDHWWPLVLSAGIFLVPLAIISFLLADRAGFYVAKVVLPFMRCLVSFFYMALATFYFIDGDDVANIDILRGLGKLRGVFMKVALAGSIIGIITACGFIILIVPGIVFTVWFYMAIPAMVDGRTGIINGLKTSKNLGRGYFFNILLVAIVIVTIVGPMSIFFHRILPRVFINIFTIENKDTIMILTKGLSTFGGVVLTPLASIPPVLLYRKLKKKQALLTAPHLEH